MLWLKKWYVILIEVEETRIEYNSRQIRDDRKIKDYFSHISNNSKNFYAIEKDDIEH